MAAKKPAAQKPAGTPAAPKPARKPKTPAMPMAMRFELMSLVKNADPTIPDARLADIATKQLGRTIQRTTIGDYRKEFGMASVGSPTRQQLAAYVEELVRLMKANGLDIPPMGADDGPADTQTLPLPLDPPEEPQGGGGPGEPQDR